MNYKLEVTLKKYLLLLLVLVPVFGFGRCLPLSGNALQSQITFQGKKDTIQLYRIYNPSSQSILLEHPQGANPGAQAGWSSIIDPNQVSVLQLNRPNFVLQCRVKQGQQYQDVACSSALQVCQFSGVSFGSEHKNGSYWVVENTTALKVIVEMAKRNILIKN